jgi:hypothetical protein
MLLLLLPLQTSQGCNTIKQDKLDVKDANQHVWICSDTVCCCCRCCCCCLPLETSDGANPIKQDELGVMDANQHV